MSQLSEKELAALKELLSREELLVKKNKKTTNTQNENCGLTKNAGSGT